jgi:hypothetical protein
VQLNLSEIVTKANAPWDLTLTMRDGTKCVTREPTQEELDSLSGRVSIPVSEAAVLLAAILNVAPALIEKADPEELRAIGASVGQYYRMWKVQGVEKAAHDAVENQMNVRI